MVYIPETLDLMQVGQGVVSTPSENILVYRYDIGSGATDWILDNNGIPITLDGGVHWSNHDILVCVGLDDAGTPIVGTEVYFSNSLNDTGTEPDADMMAVTTEWLENMADHARRLSETSDSFTPEQMDEFFGGYDPDTGGGDIIPDDGGSAADLPDAETAIFGHTYDEQPVPTGKYTYGSYGDKIPPFPDETVNGYKYAILLADTNGNPVVRFDINEMVRTDNGYLEAKPSGSYKIRLYTYMRSTGEWLGPTDYAGANYGTQFRAIYWSNFNFYWENGTLVLNSSLPIPEMQNQVVAVPVECEGEYRISGSTLNSLVSCVQYATGTEATSPNGAIDAMNKYLGIDETT
jgi:hypothetical protein